MKNPQGFSKFAGLCQLGAFLAPASVLLSLWLSFQNPNESEILWFAVTLLGVMAGLFLASLPTTPSGGNEDETPSKMGIALLFVVFVFGLSLRFTHLDFGFPFFNHPDEGPKARIVERMIASGTWNPHYFLHPSLLLYLSKLGEPLIGVLGFGEDVLHRALLAGRTVSALAGSISVLLLYFIGKRLFSWQTGLSAAAFLAFAPLHVTCSRYMKEDVLCLALMLAGVLAALKGLQEKNKFCLFAAGFLAGCGAGAKYTGILSIILLALLCFQYRKNVTYRDIFFACLFVPLGFFCCCPFAVLDSDAFVRHFLVERAHMKTGHQGVAITAWEEWWMYHWSRSLVPGLGVLGCAFALLGMGVQARHWKRIGIFVVFAFFSFYLPAEWVKAKPPPQPERYVISCVPFLALLAAEFFEWLRRHNYCGLAQVLFFAALILPASRSILLASDLKLDTRVEMREWMLENLPPDSKVLIEAAYSPRLEGTPFERKLIKASKHPALFGRTPIAATGFQYLLVNSFSYERYFSEPEYNEVLKRRFENIFKSFVLKKECKPRWGTYGFNNPTVRLYEIPAPTSKAGDGHETDTEN